MVEVLITVAEKVAEYLVDPIKLQFSYLFSSHHNVKVLLQQVENLGHAREKVTKLVEEAIQQGNEIFPHVQDWLQASQAILQTREDFVRDEERASQQGCFHLKYRYNLSKRAMKQGEDIEAKLQRAHGFGETVSYRPPPPPLISSASSTNDGAFPSRESIFNQIMEALRNEQTSIVGIWGMGGVGKTTLALQVAKREEEEKLFDKVVMASSISQTPSISEIQTELARTLGLRFPEGEDRSVALMNSLKKQKKILVILDDIWDKLDMRKIGIPYGEDHRGCKLLLTSREYEVVGTDMKAQQVFHLPHLKAEEAWSLFKTTAGDSVEYSPQLKATADEIVKKCEGLPIAIITIANALKRKSEGEWKNALNELKMAKPTNIRGMSKNVYSCLELSYNHLEGDEVKSLFLLCGLLGGRLISKDHLLLYATGLNMFEGLYSMENATNKLITCVGKLIASSLLLDVEEGENKRHRSLFFDDSFVKMHDVVRDVARSIASKDGGRQYVVSEALELQEWERRGDCMNFSGISLECRDMDELPPRLVCPELELFLLNLSLNRPLRRRHKFRIPVDFFQGVTKLRVLHMSAVSLGPSLSSLGFLSNLHTLCLIGCQLGDMIFIGEMKGLQVLSLAESRIEKLPKEIGQLKDLRVMDLQDCTELRIILRNLIWSLSGLECLNLRGCYGIEWERDGEINNKVCLSETKGLSRLRTLEVKVSDPSFIPKDIGQDLVSLTRYSITIGFDEYENLLKEFPRKLMAGGVKSFVLKSFSNLFKTCQLLSLGDLDGISNVVYDLANEHGFPQLEYLKIYNCGTIRHIVSSSGCPSLKWVQPRDTFCMLDKLDLYDLPDLESVFDFHESAPILIKCFGKLRSLCLCWCEKLRCVVYLPIQHGRELTFFPRLQKLVLNSLPNLISFYCIATTQNGQESSLICYQEVAFPTLEELYVESLGHHLQTLWHNRFSADSFSKLKKFKVENSDGLQKVFSVSLVKALVQLEELWIGSCRSLEEIITNEGEDIEDEAASLPKLTHLHLSDLCLLKKFCSPAIKLQWRLLKKLEVSKCDDQVRRLFDDVGLEGEVDAQPFFLVEKEAFPDLETLEISFLRGVVETWRGQFSRVSFSKLRVLKIWCCHAISFVISKNMVQKFHNLEELEVTQCDSMKEVIQLLDDEPTIDEIDFRKLKRLDLFGLPNLKCFSSTTCTIQFPSLKRLQLSKCPQMEYFCNGDLHINKNTLKEYILGVLHSNTQATHETSTVTNEVIS